MRIPADLAQRIDERVGRGGDGYGSRNDFITDAARRRLEECDGVDFRRDEFRDFLAAGAGSAMRTPFGKAHGKEKRGHE